MFLDGTKTCGFPMMSINKLGRVSIVSIVKMIEVVIDPMNTHFFHTTIRIPIFG